MISVLQLGQAKPMGFQQPAREALCRELRGPSQRSCSKRWLEPTEGTGQPVVFAIWCCAEATRCLLTAPSVSTAWRLLSRAPAFLSSTASPCWERAFPGTQLFSRSQLKSSFPLALQPPASCSSCWCSSQQPAPPVPSGATLGVPELVLQHRLSGSKQKTRRCIQPCATHLLISFSRLCLRISEGSGLLQTGLRGGTRSFSPALASHHLPWSLHAFRALPQLRACRSSLLPSPCLSRKRTCPAPAGFS